MRRVPLFFFLAALWWWACGDSPTAPAADRERIVEGVSFTRLFAAPSQEEIDAVIEEWQGRDTSAQNYQEVLTADLRLGQTPAALRIVSHTVGGVRHFGALIIPRGAAPHSLPLLVYAHGGDQGVSVEEFLLLHSGLPELRGQFACAIPSFRSEPLQFSGQQFLADGPPSPWDRDVDDALALIEVALTAEPAIDPERIGVLGVSRGAGVALLMAARDPRIEVVVEFFGPTDFLGPFVQEVVEEALRGAPRDLPGLDYLDQTLIEPLKAGVRSIEDLRPELIRRSPVYFASHLPQVQVHHGIADQIVPVSQAHSLIAAMRQLRREAPAFEFFLYEGGGHHPLALPGSLGRAQQFLARLLQPSLAWRSPQRFPLSRSSWTEAALGMM